MKTNIVTIAAALTVALIAGCGGSGSTPATTTALSGNVADGYLVGATVFLDKNVNYQLDAGEPTTVTGENGAYTLNVDPADVGKYPIVAMAIQGQTIDMDSPDVTVASSYILCLPARAVSGTVNSNFISPMSTLIREKLEANPDMTLTEAMTQLRTQMNLAAATDMMGDYVAGSGQGMMNAAQYQAMHTIAQQMAGIMAGQSALVMNGTAVNQNHYRSMMGMINRDMSVITANATDSTFMTGMRNQMQTQLRNMQMNGGFANYSGMFRNMTSHSNL
mgnify:CR=1 FL=1